MMGRSRQALVIWLTNSIIVRRPGSGRHAFASWEIVGSRLFVGAFEFIAT